MCPDKRGFTVVVYIDKKRHNYIDITNSKSDKHKKQYAEIYQEFLMKCHAESGVAGTRGDVSGIPFIPEGGGGGPHR